MTLFFSVTCCLIMTRQSTCMHTYDYNRLRFSTGFQCINNINLQFHRYIFTESFTRFTRTFKPFSEIFLLKFCRVPPARWWSGSACCCCWSRPSWLLRLGSRIPRMTTSITKIRRSSSNISTIFSGDGAFQINPTHQNLIRHRNS